MHFAINSAELYKRHRRIVINKYELQRFTSPSCITSTCVYETKRNAIDWHFQRCIQIFVLCTTRHSLPLSVSRRNGSSSEPRSANECCSPGYASTCVHDFVLVYVLRRWRKKIFSLAATRVEFFAFPFFAAVEFYIRVKSIFIDRRCTRKVAIVLKRTVTSAKCIQLFKCI